MAAFENSTSAEQVRSVNENQSTIGHFTNAGQGCKRLVF